MGNSVQSESLPREKKSALFAMQFTNDFFVFDAVYSDETKQFVSNPEPELNEEITVSIRTAAGNADSVFLITNTPVHSTDDSHNNSPDAPPVKMNLARTDEIFDYYTAALTAGKPLNYAFLITKGEKTYYYNKRGIFPDLDAAYNFKIIPGFTTPEWAKGAVFYQIFIDRFYNGDPSNDVVNNEYAYIGRAAKRIDNWNTPVAPDDVANFYGGDLQGIIDKLDYLQDLNVDAIYLNPIFVSPSTHKYDIQDYDSVDPHFGVIVNDGGDPLYFEKFHNRFATKYIKRTTDRENLEASNALLIKLIDAAHSKNIKVILDGVFNHCGAFNKWLDRENFYGASGYQQGAYRDIESPYKNYFRWYDSAWPNNECYDGWWGHENHPKLYYEGSPELYAYILEVAKKWVSPPYNADGWRLDVAADLGYSRQFNHKFWRDFRDSVKSANPTAIIIAEHYGDPKEWLEGGEWDTIMNYDAFMEPLTWFLTGMEKHSEEFRGDMLNNAMSFESSLRYNMARFSYPALYISMNELSNHDHSRFLTRTNMTPGRLHTLGREQADIGVNMGIMREAVVFQMLWPGAPTIYYGDEAGLTGWTDPDSRRTYPWGNENKELLEFHRELTKLRAENPCLATGSAEYLFLSHGIFSFGRWDSTGKVACALNNNAVSKELELPVWKIGAVSGTTFTALISSDMYSFTTKPAKYIVKGGCVTLKLPPYSAVVLKWE